MTIIACDIETGGLDPKIHPILSIGLAQLNRKFEVTRVLEIYVKPPAASVIDDAAIALNGYSEERWADVYHGGNGAPIMHGAIPLKKALEIIKDWLPEGLLEMLGHGAGFDKAVMEEAQQSTGVDLELERRWRCSCAAALFAFDMGANLLTSASLESCAIMAGHWEHGQRGKHRALEDAVACAAVYRWAMDSVTLSILSNHAEDR